MNGVPGFFTVKWIMPSGYTHYYQAANLTVVPRRVDDASRSPEVMGLPQAVSFKDSTGAACGIDKGVVYILNDKGSTIDRIILDAPAQEAMPAPEVLDHGDQPRKRQRTTR